MQNEIIINAEIGETRVALLEKGQFTELHIERERDKSVVGNVVKGRVSRVLPGMQAAFVDIGLEKAAFLYVGDYFESTLETGETEGEPTGGRRRGGRNGRSAPPRIDTVLHEGKEIIVQIAKAPIGTKGARITSSISIPGRHLVLTPWSRRVGVSRRIGSDKERRRLREIVDRLRPKNLGFIIRTAGDGVRDADLQADIRYLATVWAAIQQRNAEKSAPAVLYSEHDLPLRIVRDIAGHDTRRIATDDKDVHESIQSFVDRFVADPKPRIEHYEESQPIFERFGLEAQIHANLERKVWLKSGGSLVIDQSEALTAIDVNTGRFVGKRDLEETVLKTNLEAVTEVVHQLRFRNIGGLIIIDLIDMDSAGNREKVYRALQDALRSDKSRTNILKISELGLVEMTRKRTRENLVQMLCEPCSHCESRGYVLSSESVAFRLLREVRKHLARLRGRAVAVAVNPHVAAELLTGEKAALARLNEEIGRDIEVRSRPALHQEQFEISVLEPGPAVEIELPWLKELHPDSRAATEQAEAEKRSRRGRGRRRDGGADESIAVIGEVAAETGATQAEEGAPAAPASASLPETLSTFDLDFDDDEPETSGPEPDAGRSEDDAEPKPEPAAARSTVGEETPHITAPASPAALEAPQAAARSRVGISQGATEAPAAEASSDVSSEGPSESAVGETVVAGAAEADTKAGDAGDETAQAVDSEAESRIIRRSE